MPRTHHFPDFDLQNDKLDLTICTMLHSISGDFIGNRPHRTIFQHKYAKIHITPLVSTIPAE